MISKQENCLFIHIPKTAGQSVETVFLERAGLSWGHRADLLLKPNSNPRKGPPRLAHLTAREYVELGYLSEEEFNRLYKFTVVRNPWDRLVSEYTYQRYPYSFKDFIFKHFPQPGEDDYQRHHGHYRHVIPQADFVCDAGGNLLMDYVIKFEQLQQGFDEVTKALTGEALQLPHKNKTAASGPIAAIRGKLKKALGNQPTKKTLL